MSSNSHHIDVMNVSAWAFGIFFLGFLNVTVSKKCEEANIKVELIDILLKDHLFEMKNFTPPGEQVMLNHTFLSIINMVCTSWKANIDIYNETVTKNSTHNQKIMWAFGDLLKAEMCKIGKNPTEGNYKQNITEFCKSHTSNNSYCTRYIKPDEFHKIYRDAWNSTTKSEVTVAKLLCPNESTSTTIKPSTSPVTHSYTTSTVGPNATVTDNYTTSTVGPNATVTDNYTTSTVGPNGPPVTGYRTETLEKTFTIEAVFLVISVLLNIILLLHHFITYIKSIYKGPVQHDAENGVVTYGRCKNLNQVEDQVELNSIAEASVS